VFRSKALRPIAGVVLVTFSALTLQPLAAAAQLPAAPKRTQAQPVSGEERFSRTLNEIHEILKEVVPQAAMPYVFKRQSSPTAPGKPGEKVLQAVGPKLRLESERGKPMAGVDVTAKVKTLRGKYKELKSLEAEVDKGFKATEKHIRDKNLPPEILARHEAAVAEYGRRKAEFETLIAATQHYSGLTVAQAEAILDDNSDQYHRHLLSAELNVAPWMPSRPVRPPTATIKSFGCGLLNDLSRGIRPILPQ